MCYAGNCADLVDVGAGCKRTLARAGQYNGAHRVVSLQLIKRRRQLAEAEGDAKKANQSMTMAQIVLALGFLVFLGYPAMVNVLAL